MALYIECVTAIRLSLLPSGRHTQFEAIVLYNFYTNLWLMECQSCKMLSVKQKLGPGVLSFLWSWLSRANYYFCSQATSQLKGKVVKSWWEGTRVFLLNSWMAEQQACIPARNAESQAKPQTSHNKISILASSTDSGCIFTFEKPVRKVTPKCAIYSNKSKPFRWTSRMVSPNLNPRLF